MSPFWKKIIDAPIRLGDIDLQSGILKLPISYERVPVQNGLRLYKQVQNGNFCLFNMEVTCQNDGHDGP